MAASVVWRELCLLLLVLRSTCPQAPLAASLLRCRHALLEGQPRRDVRQHPAAERDHVREAKHLLQPDGALRRLAPRRTHEGDRSALSVVQGAGLDLRGREVDQKTGAVRAGDFSR